jgi:threonine/homoserine/homoserine lactone efflux protein
MQAVLYGMNAGLGLSPHTLGMLLTATVRGRKSGFLFMLGAVIFDLLLIMSVLLIQGQLEMGGRTKLILQLISGLLVIRMGWKALGSGNAIKDGPEVSGASLKEGIILQIFNPNPYLFWFMIGVPNMMAMQDTYLALKFTLIFMLVTYGLKLLMMELTVRIAEGNLFRKKIFHLVRQSVAIVMILNGSYITIQNSISFLRLN